MSNDDQPMSLRRFVRHLAPEQTAAIDAYGKSARIGAVDLTEVFKARQEVLRDPIMRQGSAEEQMSFLKDRLYVNRWQRRSDIEHFLNDELPEVVKAEMLSGRWKVIARRLADQAKVELTPCELVPLKVDILAEQLVGSAGSYGDIVIRRRADPAPEAAPATMEATEPAPPATTTADAMTAPPAPPATTTADAMTAPPAPPARDANPALATEGIAEKTITKRRRLEYLPDLQRYMQRSPALVAGLGDRGVVGSFRRFMKENHPLVCLSRRTSYIAKQVAAIRKDLAEAADGSPKQTAEKSSEPQ